MMLPDRRTAVTYARFSTDRQNIRSCEDQTVLCRDYARATGFLVVESYQDSAKSGASVLGREGLERLMRDAKAGRFKVVIVEAIDRISRDMEDLAGIYKRLSRLGIELRAVQEGRAADTLTIGLRGLVGQIFLEDIAHKVRRGLQAVVRDGRHAGGLAYGYRTVPGQPGEWQINDEEAAVLLRIFSEYVSGRSQRDIANGLNRDGIRPPRGVRWNASTINGNKARGHGILLNPIYAGRIVWNRVRMVKDPDTGRRISRVNPESEWMEAEAPHLRIIPIELFDTAQTRKAERSVAPRSHRPRAVRPLSGLLKCGVCGGGMTSRGRDHGRLRIACSTKAESGSCTSRRAYYLDAVEQAVLDGLASCLDDPKILAGYVAAYHQERRAEAEEARRERGNVERRLGEVTRAIARLVDALADGTVEISQIKGKLQAFEAERLALTDKIAQADAKDDVITLHPASIERYRQNVALIAESLPDAFKDGDRDVIDAFRALVARVIVHPTPAGEPMQIEVRGKLSALVGKSFFPDTRTVGGVDGSGRGT